MKSGPPHSTVKSIFQILKASSFAQERIGEFGSALVARMLGFENSGLKSFYRGIDAVMYSKFLDMYLILEAKGGTSGLAKGQI